MSVLKVDFPTADGALNLNRTHCVADFEDIIRLNFPNPPRWIHRQRVTPDSLPTPSAITKPETIQIDDETGFFESSIVHFRRSDRTQSFEQ